MQFLIKIIINYALYILYYFITIYEINEKYSYHIVSIQKIQSKIINVRF